MIIDIIYISVLLHKLGCSLGAYARNAGYIVRAVALYGFDLYQLARGHAVLGFDRFGRVYHRTVEILAQAYGYAVVNELQAVAVTCSDNAGTAGVVSRFRERSQYIVGLVALTGDELVPKRGQQFFQRSHLTVKLLRHSLAVGLVEVVHLVAEGLCLKIKSDRHSIGIHISLHAFKHGQKAVDGVCELTVLCGERLYTVKRAVQYAVSVYY